MHNTFYKPYEKTENPAETTGLVVVSNRLPVTFDDGGVLGLSSGGLVTAMTPVLKKKGGIWLGWPGTDADVGPQLKNFSENNPYQLKDVPLSREEVQKFYYGFSNQVLWPLFHGLPEKCRFDADCWQTYQQVNAKFAEKVAEVSTPDDYIWVQDYHLICLAQELNQAGVKRNAGFYLHTPFPSPENFFKLPWREELLQALTQFRLIGFQTPWDQANFCRCLEYYTSDTRMKNQGRLTSIRCGQSRFTSGVFPISIDFEEFSGQSDFRVRNFRHRNKNAGEEIRQQLILGVDRLDYSKGIPERLQGFDKALSLYPELRGRLRLLQVVVPSREGIEEYQQLKNEIEHLVGAINGRWSTPDWTPVQYMHHGLPREELLDTYRQADMALITPLRDGMNLVAKEYCAAKNDGNGVLILSEFAGAALQLKDGAFLVNPYDLDAMAESIHRAFHLPYAERSRLMQLARQNIRTQDIHWWLDCYLEAALQKPEKQQETRQAPPKTDPSPRPFQRPVNRYQKGRPMV